MTSQHLGGTIPVWTRSDRLRKARLQAGFSVAELAEATGISAKTINNYEADKHEPRRPSLLAWSFATGVSLEWLEHGTAPGGPPTPPEGVKTEGTVVDGLDEDGIADLAARRRSERGSEAPLTRQYVPAAA